MNRKEGHFHFVKGRIRRRSRLYSSGSPLTETDVMDHTTVLNKEVDDFVREHPYNGETYRLETRLQNIADALIKNIYGVHMQEANI